MDRYATRPCVRCGEPSTGFFQENDVSEYFCNKHWFAKKNLFDRVQDEKEYNQWKDHEWYQFAYPEKFSIKTNNLEERYRKLKEVQQQKLNL